MLSLITRLYCSFDFFVYFLYPFLFSFFFFFFFNDTATTEIYTLSLHDALPISLPHVPHQRGLSGSRNVCGARLGTPWHRCRGSSRADVLRAAGLQRRISGGRENGGASHDLRASAHRGPYRDPVGFLRGHGSSSVRSPLSRGRGVAGKGAWRRAALP